MNARLGQFILLSTLILVGSGCVAEPVSNAGSEEAAASLSFDSADTFTLRQTIFGVGGPLVKWFGGEHEDRIVTIDDWQPQDRAEISWSLTKEIETDDSKVAREAWEAEYDEVPIGVEIPDKPEAVMEQITREGTMTTTALDSAETLLLPSNWPDGEAGVFDDESIIWLSAEQYDELVNTRKTQLNLGLFDDSISGLVKYSDDIKNLIGKLQKDSEVASESEDILEITADGAWRNYVLTVNGERTSVRVIKAKNYFGQYTILANRDNPMILELILTPASQGSFNIFSRDSLLESFIGYEVTEIITE